VLHLSMRPHPEGGGIFVCACDMHVIDVVWLVEHYFPFYL